MGFRLLSITWARFFIYLQFGMLWIPMCWRIQNGTWLVCTYDVNESLCNNCKYAITWDMKSKRNKNNWIFNSKALYLIISRRLKKINLMLAKSQKKEVWRSVFLIIQHCILNIDSTKPHSSSVTFLSNGIFTSIQKEILFLFLLLPSSTFIFQLAKVSVFES